MTRHDHRHLDVWRVVGEVRDERLAETLHGEFRGAVGGVRAVRSQARPEAVDAAGVDHVGVGTRQQHRHERPGAVVDPEPADVEGAFPLLAGRVVDEARAAADAGVVEQEIDVIRVVGGLDPIAKGVDGLFVGNVAVVGGDDPALRCFLLAQALGLGQVVVENVAGGDIAAFGDQLPRQSSSHAGPAAGDDREFSAEIVHRPPPHCA